MLVDKRGFAVLSRLGEYGGTGVLVVAGREDGAGRLRGMPPDLNDAERAVALAEAGWLAIQMAVQVACDPTRGRSRKSRSVWKAMTPDSGAAAAIFMSHGLAEATRQLARGIGASRHEDRQTEARRLLRAHLPWSDVDDAEVTDASQLTRTDPAAGDQALIWGGLRRVVGDAAARKLPGVSVLLEGVRHAADRYVIGVAWQVLGTQYSRPYFALSDPEMLERGSWE